MASLFKDPAKLSAYRDRRFTGNQEEYERALQNSTTVYIGNMSFYTTEEQVYELFSRAGEIKKIIMGLDKKTKTRCGMCFVLEDEHSASEMSRRTSGYESRRTSVHDSRPEKNPRFRESGDSDDEDDDDRKRRR